MILILSKDKDFSETLSALIQSELGLECGFDSREKGVSLLVTTEQPIDIAAPKLVLDRKDAPFRAASLLADISRLCESGETPVVFSGLRLMPRQKALFHADGKQADLTEKETQLLLALAEAGKKGIGREALLREVWGFEEGVTTHTLETHIYRLRSKIADLSGSETIILTLEDGYQLQK